MLIPVPLVAILTTRSCPCLTDIAKRQLVVTHPPLLCKFTWIFVLNRTRLLITRTCYPIWWNHCDIVTLVCYFIPNILIKNKTITDGLFGQSTYSHMHILIGLWCLLTWHWSMGEESSYNLLKGSTGKKSILLFHQNERFLLCTSVINGLKNDFCSVSDFSVTMWWES